MQSKDKVQQKKKLVNITYINVKVLETFKQSIVTKRKIKGEQLCMRYTTNMF